MIKITRLSENVWASYTKFTGKNYIKQQKPRKGLCTDSEKLIEHIYGFLMVVERILKKFADKNSREKSE
ncbi:MAG TPA: hypothetical protein VGN20_12465 [Mucilaginibacter sp.]|jgi:hypothetical protein